jgi:deoxycytidine triphosphate deaminase
VHKRHAITIHVYDTNNESMMNIHKQKEKQIKMDSYDVHVHANKICLNKQKL